MIDENQSPETDLEKIKKQLEISKLEIECEQLNLTRCELKKRWFQKPQWIAALSPIFVGFLTLIVVLSSGILQNQATLNKILEEKLINKNAEIDSTIKRKEFLYAKIKLNYDSIQSKKLTLDTAYGDLQLRNYYLQKIEDSFKNAFTNEKGQSAFWAQKFFLLEKQFNELSSKNFSSYPPQNLPSWENLLKHYPRSSDTGCDLVASTVFNSVGGDVKALHDGDPITYSTAAALRLSISLNKCGIVIPNIPRTTYRGADNNFYFVNTGKLYEFLVKTFGSGNIKLTHSQGGLNGSLYKSYLNGKRGIYFMQANFPDQFGDWGHCTLYDINGTIPASNCSPSEHFDAAGGVYKITFWKF